jgi:hypothetical protein
MEGHGSSIATEKLFLLAMDEALQKIFSPFLDTLLGTSLMVRD